MDSHSRSASPREPMRPQHRPPSPPSSPGAFDNRAYQHDDADPNHNDSFTSNGPQQNGHSKEPNGDMKLPEAVNLELINLTPKNGTKKKDVEVDMNVSNPYDEYFVPVNEHRKFMRGEKLYVTADKRGEKGGCKRPLCWTLLVLVVAAIVAIIVLAATGILFSSAPTTLEQYNTSISSARALGGIIHDHDHHDHDHDHDHAFHDHAHDHTTEPAHTQHGPDTQSDEAVQPVGSDDNDMSIYVPRTVEGELKIDNEEFTPALEDPDSAEYRDFVATFAHGLKHALFDRNTLENGDSEVTVEVIRLRKGSVVVTYRIHWKPKLNAEPSPNLLSADSLKTKLDSYLADNNRMINVYHVAEDKMSTKHVLDICQIDNNHCEHGCEFDETTLEFSCTCPHGQILDITNPNKCMSILENAYPLEPKKKEKEITVLRTDSNLSIKPMSKEQPITESSHVSENDNVFDWKETHHALPETTTENEADLNLSHIFGHGYHEHDSKAPVPEPTAESNAEPEPTAEPNSEPEPTAEPKAEPEPTAEPKTEPQPIAEPKAEPEPTAEPKAEPQPTAQTKAEPEPAAEPNAEPEPTAEPKAEPEPTSEPKAEPEPTAEPRAEPEPNAEPQSEAQPISNKVLGLHDTAEPAESQEPAVKPTAEPTAEPTPEPEPISEPELSSEHAVSNHNISDLEVILLPTTESAPVPTLEPNTGTEPESEPPADLIPTTELHSSVETTTKSHSLDIHQTVDQENNPTTTSEPVSIEKLMEHEAVQHMEHESNPEEMTTLTISEGSYDSKLSDEIDITTMRVSISEPNIINEPSYEPKPEIISILSESVPKYIAEDNNKPTEQNQWLQHYSKNDMKQPTELTNNNDHNDSEQRSYKSDIFAEEDTTTSKTEDYDILKVLNEQEDKLAMTEKTNNEEHTTITNVLVDKKDATNRFIINSETTSGVAKIEKELEGKTSAVSEIFKGDKNSTESKEHVQNNKEKSIINEERPLDSNEESTIIPVSFEEYSITEQAKNNDLEKNLMEALGKRNESKQEMDTESNVSDDGMDITFNSINMLYNRSSKSIENEMSNKSTVTITPIIEPTTVSEWLAEPVTEIKYAEVINKMEKQETTETIATKIDEIIDSGVTKDDFEPDYLNNMSLNNNKMTDQDEPIFGMALDYDSEDSRVKRVNQEKEIVTEATTTNVSSEAKENIKESSPGSVPIETTTVFEYIYKSAETALNEPVSPVPQNNLGVVSLDPTTSTEKSEPAPAPVWEDSEAEKDLSVKELEKPEHTEEESITTRGVAIDVKSTTPTILMSSAPAATTQISELLPSPTTHTMPSNIQEIPRSESDPESQTQVNNLNVTIYEISSHNGNNSFAVNNQHSGEIEDHETEMNPFLPEVENNKSLVKKLQEGHDIIEPTTFNETQNENTDEHINNTSETTTRVANNEDLNIQAKSVENKATTTVSPVTTEVYTTFNDLMKSQDNKTEEAKKGITDAKGEDKKTELKKAPISTFLLDTDDLDSSKELTTEHKTTIAENNMENGVTPSSSPLDDESDYLSVVPIEEERIEEKESTKKDYEGSELNDISDSPKKSDRRTLDETKFDSVNNNEA